MNVVKKVAEKARGWAIERRIPVTYIITLVVGLMTQTAIFIVILTAWQTKTDMRLLTIETKQSAQDVSNRDTEAFRRDFIDKLARIEENTKRTTEVLGKIQNQ